MQKIYLLIMFDENMGIYLNSHIFSSEIKRENFYQDLVENDLDFKNYVIYYDEKIIDEL